MVAAVQTRPKLEEAAVLLPRGGGEGVLFQRRLLSLQLLQRRGACRLCGQMRASRGSQESRGHVAVHHRQRTSGSKTLYNPVLVSRGDSGKHMQDAGGQRAGRGSFHEASTKPHPKENTQKPPHIKAPHKEKLRRPKQHSQQHSIRSQQKADRSGWGSGKLSRGTPT